MLLSKAMRLVIEDLRAVNFHDSAVLDVREGGDSIVVKMDCACIGPPLKETSGRVWLLSDCTFTCFGVSRSEKEEWDDTKSPRAHSAPSRPMNEILDQDVKDGALELGGFTERRTWAVWRIVAKGFELRWGRKAEFKGFGSDVTNYPGYAP